MKIRLVRAELCHADGQKLRNRQSLVAILRTHLIKIIERERGSNLKNVNMC
jgi:hypothetical protein